MPWYLTAPSIAAAFVLGVIVGGYCASWFAAAWSTSELFRIQWRSTNPSMGPQTRIGGADQIEQLGSPPSVQHPAAGHVPLAQSDRAPGAQRPTYQSPGSCEVRIPHGTIGNSAGKENAT